MIYVQIVEKKCRLIRRDWKLLGWPSYLCEQT